MKTTGLDAPSEVRRVSVPLSVELDLVQVILSRAWIFPADLGVHLDALESQLVARTKLVSHGQEDRAQLLEGFLDEIDRDS
jgi:hypothetical protein